MKAPRGECNRQNFQKNWSRLYKMLSKTFNSLPFQTAHKLYLGLLQEKSKGVIIACV